MLAAALLGGCGAADDLKDRWLVLPSPPETLTREGPGTPEIAGLDLLNWEFETITPLSPFGDDDYPTRLDLHFTDGRAEITLGGEGTRRGAATLSFDEDDIYYSDANGDSFQDAIIILDQEISYGVEDDGGEHTHGILALTYSEESVGDVFYLNLGPVDHISAIEGGFSLTTVEVDGYRDTIEMGWPSGVPVRIDEHGGAVQCVDSMEQIEKALEAEPIDLESLAAHPGRDEIAGYDEQALFPLPVDPGALHHSEYERMIFLLEGGDIHRWTDYRCGWAAISDL